MEELEYKGYLITKDARIFNLSTKKEIMPTIHKSGKLSYRLNDTKFKIDNIVCELLFGEISNSRLVQCDYLKGFCISDLFNNVKIYNKLDIKNKSKNYIALNNNEPWFFENNKPKHKSENIRLELNLF